MHLTDTETCPAFISHMNASLICLFPSDSLPSVGQRTSHTALRPPHKHHTQSIRRPEPPQRPLVARHEAAPAGEDLGKLNIWCEDTQLQDPSTVNTCVMLNRMDKWGGGGQRHGAALSMCRGVHAGVGVCACGRVCVVSEASPDVNISLQKYHTHTYAHTLTETHACQLFISEI